MLRAYNVTSIKQARVQVRVLQLGIGWLNKKTRFHTGSFPCIQTSFFLYYSESLQKWKIKKKQHLSRIAFTFT